MGDWVSGGADTYGTVGEDMEKIASGDLVGAKFTMHGCRLLDSTINPGKKYILADVEVKGDHFAWMCTGVAVVEDCVNNGKAGNFPAELTLEAYPTDKGNDFLKLRSQ